MSSQLQPAIPTEEQTFIDKVIRARTGRPGALLGILGEVQERHAHDYLPPETLRYIAAKTEIPLSRIYSVATFYALFNLQPQGDNTICICRGTACHTRGSRNLLESARLDLGLGSDGAENENDHEKMQLTSTDQKFTLRTVACFGQCAMAPVVEVNHRICGHATERTLRREIDTIRAGD
jgi:NADH-quinone oxidoreductase subunit E